MDPMGIGILMPHDNGFLKIPEKKTGQDFFSPKQIPLSSTVSRGSFFFGGGASFFIAHSMAAHLQQHGVESHFSSLRQIARP